MPVIRVNERRLTINVIGLTLLSGLFGGCGDDEGQPVVPTVPDGGTTIDQTLTTREATSSAVVWGDAAVVSETRATNSSLDASADAAWSDTSTNDDTSQTRRVDAGDAEVGGDTSAESRAPASSAVSISLETTLVDVTSSGASAPVAIEPEAGASSHAAVDAGAFEPDATIVQTSSDFAGSAHGEGADNIDDAVIAITLQGPIHSLLVAEADRAWAINGDAYWWSRPGDAIPVATPVLGGLTTEWNLYVAASGSAHMTDRAMTALGAGTHDLEIYLSWPSGSRPKYYVLLGFDDEGNVVSTSHLVY